MYDLLKNRTIDWTFWFQIHLSFISWCALFHYCFIIELLYVSKCILRIIKRAQLSLLQFGGLGVNAYGGQILFHKSTTIKYWCSSVIGTTFYCYRRYFKAIWMKIVTGFLLIEQTIVLNILTLFFRWLMQSVSIWHYRTTGKNIAKWHLRWS